MVLISADKHILITKNVGWKKKKKNSIRLCPKIIPVFPLFLFSSSCSFPQEFEGVWVCGVCVWIGIWTTEFVATSVRAARPCRQGRSLQSDARGVCSSSPPLSINIHTHPTGYTSFSFSPLEDGSFHLSVELTLSWDSDLNTPLSVCACVCLCQTLGKS